MNKPLILAAALLVTAPAFAAPQQTAPAQEPAEAGNATPAATSVAAIVDSEFPAYDTNKSGQLEQPEFAKWMIALKDQELKATGKTLPPAEVSAWASGAFTSADADGSAAVSKPELVRYLGGGAA